MGDNALTSENALSHNNLRAHSPQTAGDNRPQPDTPIGLEESWRNANSCARCRSPGCAVPYEDGSPGKNARPSRVDPEVRGRQRSASYSSNFGERRKANYIYLTATLDAATWGAELAVGEGPSRIYRVEPTPSTETGAVHWCRILGLWSY